MEKHDVARQAASDKLYDEDKLQLDRRITMARIQTHTQNLLRVALPPATNGYANAT